MLILGDIQNLQTWSLACSNWPDLFKNSWTRWPPEVPSIHSNSVLPVNGRQAVHRLMPQLMLLSLGWKSYLNFPTSELTWITRRGVGKVEGVERCLLPSTRNHPAITAKLIFLALVDGLIYKEKNIFCLDGEEPWKCTLSHIMRSSLKCTTGFSFALELFH